MKARDKVVHNGTLYYSVGATARLLGTTKAKVNEMMGRGELKWMQFKINGPLFITATSIAACGKWPNE